MIPFPPFAVVLTGTALLGLTGGMVGMFAMLRRRSLLSDAIAHAALPGVCISYLIIGERHLGLFLLGAFLFGLIAAGTVLFVRSFTRVKEDAAIGIAIGCYFGLGIALSRLIQNEPTGNRAGLDSFIFGKAASMIAADALTILGIALVSLVVILLFFKEFALLAFDRGFAQSLGKRVALYDGLLMGLVALATVGALPAVGVVLVVSLLTIPAVTARLWSDQLGRCVLIAGCVGLVSGVMGTIISTYFSLPGFIGGTGKQGWPTGPMITLSAAFLFLLSLLFAPERGIVAVTTARRRQQRRIRLQNLLRAVGELLELRGGRSWSPAELRGYRRPSYYEKAFNEAIQQGFIRARDGGYDLTDEGVTQVRKILRAHRIWELYLIERADIAPDHVDRDADQLEHVLNVELISRLEEQLRRMGRLPGGDVASPHVLHGPAC